MDINTNIKENPEDVNVHGSKGDPRKEHIDDAELNTIKQLQLKANYAKMAAEKSYSDARVAELEALNFILITYNKYKLINGKDTITNDGLIIRLDETNLNPEE